MSVTKKGFSAKEIQKQLGLKCYEPVWQMTHKLKLFSIASSEAEQAKSIRGKGAVGKTIHW